MGRLKHYKLLNNNFNSQRNNWLELLSNYAVDPKYIARKENKGAVALIGDYA